MNKTRKTNFMNRIISIALVFVMAFMLISLDTGRAIADEDHDEGNETFLYYEHENIDIEQRTDIDALQEEPGKQTEPGDGGEDEANEITENEIADEGTGEASNNGGREGSSETNAEEVSRNNPGSDEATGNEATGNEATGNEATGNEATGKETRENESSNANEEGPEVSANTASPVFISISGFVWVDGNGDLDTDWNGMYEDNEYPLPDYPVSLYSADDLSSAIAVAWTDADGRYAFENLAPGRYVLEIRGENVWGVDYLPPVFITNDNKFEIDWTVPGIPAYSDVIILGEGQTFGNVNAGMRLPMGVEPYAQVTLANLANAKVNDTVFIDNNTWVVVKKQTVGTGSDAVNAVYLIMRGGVPTTLGFGDKDYNISDLRTRMNNFYKSNRWPTMNAIALVPNIGTDHSSTSFLTQPTADMAGPGSEDVYFAPSLRDMEVWAGANYGAQISTGHPLNKGAPQPFPTRFWFRTRLLTSNIYGYNRLANMIEGGLNPNGYDQIWDTPAVWVNAGVVNGNVDVHYVDTEINYINGAPQSTTYPVVFGSAFELATPEIPDIEGYNYIEWRKGENGASQDITENPYLTHAEVSSIKELYLVYEDDSAHKVTVHYVNEYGNSIGVPPDTYRVDDGDDFILDTFPTIYGYRYTGSWQQDSTSSPIRDDDVEITNITADIDVFLIFVMIDDIEVADGDKNAYVRGSTTAENGSAGNPVPVEAGDTIRYTITADNDLLTGNLDASYDVMFVLDWSESMASTMVPGQSARLYERDVMLDMSDFILDNYPNSRISVMAMNSTGMTNNPVNTYIQLQTDFLDKSQFEAARNSISSAFDVAPKNPTEDLVSFLKAARQRMEGNQVFTYGNNAGGVVNTIPRTDKTRTPVIILISDFQIPESQSVSGESYWKSLMKRQSDYFAEYSPGGILLTVRFDHMANTTGPNKEYSNTTHDSLMIANVSPSGHANWGFIKVPYGTSYTEALRKVKNDFLQLAPPGANLGTKITDKVPDGLVVDTNSISHYGTYDPITSVITWDLSEEDPGEITVEFTVTVEKIPGIFRNKADVVYYDGVEGSTNTTYHESKLRESVDVTISKTVTGRFSNKNALFEFTVFLVDENAPGNNPKRVFEYTGGVLPGTNATAPKDDVLTLSDDGDEWAAFRLSHGQTITIHDIPVGTYIMVVEDDYDRYATTIIDSKDSSVTKERYIDLQPVGNEDRRFDFTNDLEGMVPTGIESGPWGIVAFALISIALITLGPEAVSFAKRRMAAKSRRG